MTTKFKIIGARGLAHKDGTPEDLVMLVQLGDRFWFVHADALDFAPAPEDATLFEATQEFLLVADFIESFKCPSPQAN